jgi:signal transduction histidine kinase
MRPAAALLPVGLLVLLGVLEVVAVDGVKAQDAVRLAGALLAPLPFLYRARAPLAVACAVTALLLGRQLVGDLGTPTISQNFFQYVAMFVVGAYSRTVAGAIAGWIVVFGGALGAILYEGVDYPGDAYVFFTVANFAAAAAGVSVRRRIRQAAELERVRSQLARQRREAVAAAVAGERMNVARELHDVVGHSVTVMAVQAGAALALAGRDPAAARAAAESVVEYESVVGAELGQLLRALRSDGGSVTPTRLADVVELVERSRRAGLPVRFESDGDLSVVAPWLIATAYRIVQEALTNVRRHAGDAPTCVSVRVDPSLLRVEVRNDRGTAVAARPGSGAGIAGMRERTVVHGGAFEAGETPDGGWCVSALLPVGEREPAPA